MSSLAYSTRASSSATKCRCNASWAENNGCADTGSGSYNCSALKKIALVGLDGKSNGISDFLLVTTSQRVGRGGCQCGEGRNDNGGEAHSGGCYKMVLGRLAM
jgi:hypothetical protein